MIVRSASSIRRAMLDGSNYSVRPAESTRFIEIDFIKAIGIIAVILIHSLRAPWDPEVSSAEAWFGVVTRFAVPGFLLCSGFLYATEKPIPLPTVLRRLRRVLIPYLVCSIVAQIWWMSRGQAHSFDEIIQELLLGSSFGPYYYVFVHFFLVLFAPLCALLPRSAIACLTALLILSQGWLESRTTLAIPIFWLIRSPLLWWGYFMLGWLIRLHQHSVRRWINQRRSALTAFLALGVALLSGIAIMEDRTEWIRAAMWLDIYAILAFIFVATNGRKGLPTFVSVLSDATFAIYLLHLFFVYAMQLFVQPMSGEFDVPVIAGYWVAGLFGALAVIAAVKFLFGPQSKDLIGA